ncbi:MAG TPA: 2-isopropylmalate synthase [Actinocrinis sp.]|nr:2-isopropylmalate synthase [Actinocrinis sp.]
MERSDVVRRYSPFTPVELPDRTWPDRSPDRAPRWLSTDLRDGNQALAVPMSPQRKLALFEQLVAMGYREIEIGYPVASKDEYDFVRLLIEEDRIPDDVRISVLVQAREDLIRRTAESLHGARNATIHVYNATCPQFRSLVFGMTRDQCKALAVEGTRLMMKYAEKELADCNVGYQYSPELFNETELDFSLEVCEAVMDLWEPGPGRELVLNFPATVERARPNVFADQIEWLDRNLSHREDVCLSIHPHNDRGTGIASAELALLAGAQRVEGCLFSGGERAGNVCLVTLGLNYLTQGIDPEIDFSDIEGIRRTVEECTGMKVPERFPYAGDLVFTAFSGSHQDAINKGFAAAQAEARTTGVEVRDLPWTIPYLPIDPEDIGRSYEAVVRINSHSGKGGIAYVMSTWHGLNLPRGLQIEFARAVQTLADDHGEELTPESIRRCFEQEYLRPTDPAAIYDALEALATVTLYVGGAGSNAEKEALATLTETFAPWDVDVRDVHMVGDQQEAVGQHNSVKIYAECTFNGPNGAGALGGLGALGTLGAIGTLANLGTLGESDERGNRKIWGAAIGVDLRSLALEAVRVAAARSGILTPRLDRRPDATKTVLTTAPDWSAPRVLDTDSAV